MLLGIRDDLAYGGGLRFLIFAAPDEMWAKSHRGDELLAALMARARDADALRPDVTPIDISLLIEQLGTSPVLEQLRKQGRDDLAPAAVAARRRIIAIALDGLHAGHTAPLPGHPPSEKLFTERWAREPHPGN